MSSRVLNTDRRTVPQLMAAATKDSDAASVFYNGSDPTDYDGAIVVIKGRENTDYLVAMLARQNLVTIGKPVECWCHTCRPLGPDRMEMVLCPDCGNKRCPKANHHRNACTRSNEPGQKGGAYEHAAFGAAPPTASPGDLEYSSWVPFPSRTQYVRQLEKAAEGWRLQCESARAALTHAEDDLLTRSKHQNRDVWYWQGDGEDHPESMGRHMVVVIRAPDLQRLLRRPERALKSRPGRDAILAALIALGHQITADEVRFFRDASKDTTALSQLCDSLDAAWVAPPQSPKGGA